MAMEARIKMNRVHRVQRAAMTFSTGCSLHDWLLAGYAYDWCEASVAQLGASNIRISCVSNTEHGICMTT